MSHSRGDGFDSWSEDQYVPEFFYKHLKPLQENGMPSPFNTPQWLLCSIHSTLWGTLPSETLCYAVSEPHSDCMFSTVCGQMQYDGCLVQVSTSGEETE
jgi:hypothetical protein